jgi:hypothetical protein
VWGKSRTGIGVSGDSYGGVDGSPPSDGVQGYGYNGIHGVCGAAGGSGVLGESYLGLNGVYGKSATVGGNGVLGEHSVSGNGVTGQTASQSADNAGVRGVNTGKGPGVYGLGDGNTGVVGKSTNFNGGWFESSQAEGVRGICHNPNHGGVVGVSDQNNGIGVFGTCDDGKGGVVGTGVVGRSRYWGVLGESQDFEGVRGISHNPNHGGVVGICDKANGIGVYGFCDDGSKNLPGTGVFGESSLGEGVHGQTNSPTMAGVAGIMLNPQGTGAGVYGESRGRGPAGYFKGDVLVTGDITLINQDCAEDFNISVAEEIEPGTVMVIRERDELQMSRCPYDKRVAGVISGAGSLKPAIVLGKLSSQNKRMPLALLGKVYCKVDARHSSIEIGDLLTTSSTPGHAMKATDPVRAFGTVIGKALEPLDTGQGLIPILVALQ